MVAATAFTLVDKATVVFLQQGESQYGQIDLVMRPTDLAFVNYTQAAINSRVDSSLAYHTSRHDFRVLGYDKSCSNKISTLSFDDQGVEGSRWRYYGECSSSLSDVRVW